MNDNEIYSDGLTYVQAKRRAFYFISVKERHELPEYENRLPGTNIPQYLKLRVGTCLQ